MPIAVVAVLGALKFVPESRDERAQKFDVPGAVLVTGGLMALVYALVKGNDNGWNSIETLGMLDLAGLLLIAFILVQRGVEAPLVPFRIFKTRSVLGADLGLAVRRRGHLRHLLLPDPVDAAGQRLDARSRAAWPSCR